MEVKIRGVLELRIAVEHARIIQLRKMRTLRANQTVFKLIRGVGNGVELGSELIALVAVYDAVDDVAFKRHDVCDAVGWVGL